MTEELNVSDLSTDITNEKYEALVANLLKPKPTSDEILSGNVLTISRGLTRINTIMSQLSKIERDIQKYGAWPNHKIIPLAEQGKDLQKNQNAAKELVRSMYQQYQDLLDESLRIKRAINDANNTTLFSIAGKTMSINDALFYQKTIAGRIQSLTSCYERSVVIAENAVEQFNCTIGNMQVSDTVKTSLFADVIYLVPKADIESNKKFLSEFLTELNGRLNEVNAVTPINLG